MEFIQAKSIINRVKDPKWFGAKYNMNIYKGCSHGCIYCDSRSDCYQVEQFERVRAKANALEIINKNLSSKAQGAVIATGAMSDPYNPFEKKYELTRHSLELIDAYGFGVAIATKSPLVTRDIDILQSIQQHSPVLVKITITTANDALSKKIEQHVAPSSQRFQALKTLKQTGIDAGILLMPILPLINDNQENLLEIIQQAKACGVKFIYPAFGVTLRANQKEHFYKKLDKIFPGLKEKYQKKYNNSYNCVSPNAKALYSILAQECTKLKIHYQMSNIIQSYQAKYKQEQYSLL